jgi:GNAT superfamily N-acetyltransferase
MQTTKNKYPHIVIREAKAEDVPAIYQLILELAEFEQALKKVENTEAHLLEDGFGENPLYKCFVADDHGAIAGIALVYFRYSTWKGRSLYLEDLIVTHQRRGEGLGKALLVRCADYARQTGSRLMIWQVLDWNTGAIDFYKSLGAELQPEWINCVLPSEAFPVS